MNSNRIRSVLILWFVLLAFSNLVASQETNSSTDFGDAAFTHVEYLAQIGIRRAGSANEQRAIEYISNQFRQAGLKVEVHPFEFSCFEWSRAELKVGGTSFVPELIGFNPYEGELTYAGEMVLLDPNLPEEQLETLELKDSVIVTFKTESPTAYFRLLPKMPRLIVLLRKDDHRHLAELANLRFTLHITGSVKAYRSANVVATLAPSQVTSDDIVISAHLDSYKNSPGADDNGSGVGVMIELARHFKRVKEGRTANLKFVSFGAEEVGVLGARMYLSRHERDLKNCRLLFNIDRVGGTGVVHIEALGGIVGISPNQARSQLPTAIFDKSWEGLESGWTLNAPAVLPLLKASNRPCWLVEAIQGSIEETGLKVSLSGGLGGDSMVFSEAGIVTSGMAIGGNLVHSPKDLPSQVSIQSLENCGRFVRTLLLRVMATKPWPTSLDADGRFGGGSAVD